MGRPRAALARSPPSCTATGIVVPLLLDTGAIYALADADDAWHIPMRDFLKQQRQSLLVPVTVIPEAAYLIRKRLGPPVETRFADSLAAGEIAWRT